MKTKTLRLTDKNYLSIQSQTMLAKFMMDFNGKATICVTYDYNNESMFDFDTVIVLQPYTFKAAFLFMRWLINAKIKYTLIN